MQVSKIKPHQGYPGARPGVKYAFTLTLRPKCYAHTTEKQYDDTYRHVKRQLEHLCYSVTLIAEYTSGFNIHYHGVCNFDVKELRNSMKDFYECFRNDNLVGFVNIKQITDEDKWKDYIRKSFDDMILSVNRRPIIMDDFDYYGEEERATYGVTW